jgi:hypothetical protein
MGRGVILALGCGGGSAEDASPASPATALPPQAPPPVWAWDTIVLHADESCVAPVEIDWVLLSRRDSTDLVTVLRRQAWAVPLGGVAGNFAPAPDAPPAGETYFVAVLRGWLPDPRGGPVRTMVLRIQSPLRLEYQADAFAGIGEMPRATYGAVHVWSL